MPVPVMKQKETTDRTDERGAALIATVAILALLSVFITVGIRFLDVEQDVDRRLETKQQLEFIADQIAAYVHRERRLPCPADPSQAAVGLFGTEDRAAAGPCNQIGGQFTGIVPFRTLFIDNSNARDGWGRFISYSISPVFADTRDPQPANTDNNIFYICRTEDWVNRRLTIPPQAIPPPPNNENPLKARFCCPGPVTWAPGTDLEILDENGNPYNLRPDLGPAPAAGTPQRTNALAQPGAYASIDALVGDPFDQDDPVLPVDPNFITQENIVAFAIALVSHGPNGSGSFIGNGTLNQLNRPPAPLPSAAEEENADGDNVFVDQPTITTTGSPNYFDDIVLWRTQFSLYNELSNATCSRAWR